MEQIIITIIQYVLAPVIGIVVTYLLTKQQQKPKEPVTVESETIPQPYNADKDRYFMECDLTKHYFFDTGHDFQMTIRHDYRTNDSDSIVDKAVEIVASNFIHILSEVYMDEAIYWQNIFGGCYRTNSCIECIVTSEEFLRRQNEAFDTFVDLFSFFYSYYGYSYDEVLTFKKTVKSNDDFVAEMNRVKKDIKKICLRDTVCIKRKMFRILERMHGFVQTVENGIDEAIVNLRSNTADDRKLFRNKHPLMSIEEMKTQNIVDGVDAKNLLRDIRDSFEMHEEKMRS